MYEDFYNFTGRPFQLTPDPRFYFSSKTHKKAMAYLTYGLSQHEGFIIVTGGIGTGKTTLVRHLFETLDHDEYVSAMIVSTQLSGEDFLRSVIAAFGLDSQAANDKGQLIMQLAGFLREQFHQGRHALLVVDEAQILPNEVLEEMRMMSNFQEGDSALLQSFLVGQPELRAHVFESPDLEQLRQRVIATHHLEPLEPDEVADYIQHRLSLVGWDGDPSFTAEAVEKIYEFSKGTPRILNTLMSRILLFGSLEEIHEIDEELTNTVIEEMSADRAAKNVSTTKSNFGGSFARSPAAPADQKKEITAEEKRIRDLEQHIKSQDETMKKLTELMTEMTKKD